MTGVGVLPTDLSTRFREGFRHHPAGVALIVAASSGESAAVTVSSMISVSLTPPTIAFSVSDRASVTPVLLQSETYVVQLLASDELEMAVLGATHGADRFHDPSRWSHLATGELYYLGASTLLRASTAHTVEAGGSTLVVAVVHDVQRVGGKTSSPLVYHDRTWHRLGDGTELEGAR